MTKDLDKTQSYSPDPQR